MPALVWLGRRWQISTDFVPFVAGLGAVMHVTWFVLAAILLGVTSPRHCGSTINHKLYLSVMVGLLVLFGLTLVTELALIKYGLKGTPFETSTRKRVVPVLTLRLVLFGLLCVFDIYATCIVEGVNPPACWKVKHADDAVRALVFVTWGYIAFFLCELLLIYNLFPDYQNLDSWRRRIKMLMIRSFRQQTDIMQQVREKGQGPLRRTTRLFASLIKDVDLAPTDQVVGLILLAALQRRRRRIHISAMLRPDHVPAGTNASQRKATAGIQDAEQSGSGSSSSDGESSSSSSSTSSDHTESTDVENASTASERYGIAESNLNKFLTPSIVATDVRKDLDPQQAADIYTGHHDSVPNDVLREGYTFAKYAVAVYGSSGYLWQAKSNLQGYYSLLFGRGWNAHKRNELNRDKIKTLEDRLNYESVIQYAGIEDKDLLYFSYANKALGELPYFIALDHPTKSLVVSIRGSVSAADWFTDMIGVPGPADEWLPDSFKEAHPDLGPCYAHTGIMAAAEAVWNDLQSHGILQVLTNATGRHPDAPASQAHDQGYSPANHGGQLNPAHDRPNDYGGADDNEEAQEGSDAPAKQRPGRQNGGESGKASGRGASDIEMGGNAEQPGNAEDCRPTDKFGRKSQHLPEERGKYVAEVMRRGLHQDGWKLVLTGHSLGAGVAALIALKLLPDVPDVHAWAYCPPGGLVSENLAQAMKPVCTSVIVGKDAISRTSLRNLSDLMDEMLIALARCRLPTLEVMWTTSGRVRRKRRIDELLCTPEELPAESLERLKQYQDRTTEISSVMDMFPPGNTMFMRRLKARKDAKQLRIFGRRLRRPHLPHMHLKVPGGHQNHSHHRKNGQADASADGSHKGRRHRDQKRRRRANGAARMERQPAEAVQRASLEGMEFRKDARGQERARIEGLQDASEPITDESAAAAAAAAAINAGDHGGSAGRAGSNEMAPAAVPMQRQPPEAAQRATLEGMEMQRVPSKRHRVAPIAGSQNASGSLPVPQSGSLGTRVLSSAVMQMQRQPSEVAVRASLDGVDRGRRQPADHHTRMRRAASVRRAASIPAQPAAPPPQAQQQQQQPQVAEKQGGAAAGLAGPAHAEEPGQQLVKAQQSAAPGWTFADAPPVLMRESQLADEILEEVTEELEAEQNAKTLTPAATNESQAVMTSPFSMVGANAVNGDSPTSGHGSGGPFGASSGGELPPGVSLYFPTASSSDPEQLRRLPLTESGHLLVDAQLAAQRQAELEQQKNASLLKRMGVRERKKSRSSYRTYWDAVWIEPREIIDEGILISKQMASDHYTTTLLQAMQSVLMNAGKEIAGGPQMHLLHGNDVSPSDAAVAAAAVGSGFLDPRVDRSSHFPNDDWQEQSLHPLDALEFTDGNAEQPTIEEVISQASSSRRGSMPTDTSGRSGKAGATPVTGDEMV